MPTHNLPAMSLRENPPSTPNLIPQAQAGAGLTVKEKLGYGLGDTASHFVWDMVGFWLLIFYTDVYKIPAGGRRHHHADRPFLGHGH